MIPSWKHGVAMGILLSITLGIFLIYHDLPKNLDTDQIEQVAITMPEIVDEPKPKPKPKPIELPFGGRELFPKYRFVALYGSPEFSGLGSLGEQPLQESVIRAKDLAASYQKISEEKVVPTFEIIATVASANPTENDDYSSETSIDKLMPWVKEANKNGMYVVLDLQPGRSSFLTQAKLYEGLLKMPGVGLGLDPEWRLQTKDARHLITTGSVTAEEINQTSKWLADLIKQNELPPKIFIVHQFKISMISQRESLDTSREELFYILHMDGFGTLNAKTETLNTVKAGLPKNMYIGWKNFFDEDIPTPTPEQTMSQIPKPWFVSYQ